MEHYLGEKLKKLRESRGWTQADLAKRLNKAVSTVSGYESDAHAIPLDVLASISSLFNISTDELLGLDAPEVLSLSGLTGAQKKTLIKLRNELLSPSQKGDAEPAPDGVYSHFDSKQQGHLCQSVWRTEHQYVQRRSERS